MPLEVQERYDYGSTFGAGTGEHQFPTVAGDTIFWFPCRAGDPILWFDTGSVTGGTIAYAVAVSGAILAADGFIYVTPAASSTVGKLNPATKTVATTTVLMAEDNLTPEAGRWGVATAVGNRIVARWCGFREGSKSGTSNRWLHIDTDTFAARGFRPPPYWLSAQSVSDTIFVPSKNAIYSIPKNQVSGYSVYKYPLLAPYNLVTDPASDIGMPGTGVRYGSQAWLGQDGTTIYFGNHSGIDAVCKLDTTAMVETVVELGGSLTARVDEARYGHSPWVHLGGGVHVGVNTNSTTPALRFDESTETITTLANVGPNRPGGVLAGNGRAYWGDLGSSSVTEYDPGTGLFSAIPREAGSNMQQYYEPVNVGGNVYFLEQTGVFNVRVAWITDVIPPSKARRGFGLIR